MDKYNLIFVYFKNYESGGKIRKQVTWYMLFVMILYMLIMTSFFSAKFNTVFLEAGVVLIVAWVIAYKVIKCKLMKEYSLDKNLAKKKRRDINAVS